MLGMILEKLPRKWRGVLSRWLRKLGFGRLPGDIDIQRNGRRYSFPVGSTVMLSLLASLIYWMLR